MMKMLRFDILTVVLVLLTGTAIAGPKQDFERKIIEQFPISANGEVEIVGKYGHINMETWAQNEVKFEVTITVDARSQEKANEIFDQVKIDFSNTSSHVRAETQINTSKSWTRWFGNNSSDFDIVYKVWIPATVSVDLANKYGDIVLASIEGDCNIDLKYGNMTVDDIGGDLTLDMGYAKGSVGSTGNADLDIKYSKLKCENMGDITVTSKYSGIEVGDVGMIQSNTGYDGYKIKSASSLSNVGKYDDFAIEEIGNINMNTKYSHLDVGHLGDEADVTFKHGGIKIKSLASDFSKVQLVGDYASIQISAEQATNYSVDLEGKYTSFKINTVIETYHDVRTNNETTIKGKKGGGTGGTITARLSYGTFRLN